MLDLAIVINDDLERGTILGLKRDSIAMWIWRVADKGERISGLCMNTETAEAMRHAVDTEKRIELQTDWNPLRGENGEFTITPGQSSVPPIDEVVSWHKDEERPQLPPIGTEWLCACGMHYWSLSLAAAENAGKECFAYHGRRVT